VGQYTDEQADTLLTEIEFIYSTNPLYFADKYDWIEFAISKFNLSEEQALTIFRSPGVDLINLLRVDDCSIFTYRSANIRSIRSMQSAAPNAQIALETLRSHNGNFDVISQKHKCINELISRYRYNPDKAQALIERHNNNFVAVLAEANAIQKIMETGKSLQQAEDILVANNYNYGLILAQFYNRNQLATYSKYVDPEYLRQNFPDDIDLNKSLKFAKKMKSLSEQLMQQQSCTEEVSIRMIKEQRYNVEAISRAIFKPIYMRTFGIEEGIIDEIISILKLNDEINKGLELIKRFREMFGLSNAQVFKILKLNTENYANILKQFYTQILELIGGKGKLPINIDVYKAFDIIFGKTLDPVELAKFLVYVNRLCHETNAMGISIQVILETYIRNNRDYDKTYCDLVYSNRRIFVQKYNVDDSILHFIIIRERMCDIRTIEKILQMVVDLTPFRPQYQSLRPLEVFMRLCSNPLFTSQQIIDILNRKLIDHFKLSKDIVERLLSEFSGDLELILVRVYQRVASITEIEARQALQEFRLDFAGGLRTLRNRLNNSIDAYNKGHSAQQSLASDFRSAISMELLKDTVKLGCCGKPCSLWSIMNIAVSPIPCPFCRRQLSVDQRNLSGKTYNFPMSPPNKLAFKIILELRERLRGIGYYPNPPLASVQMSTGQLRNEEMERLDPEMFAKITALAVATRFGPDSEDMDEEAEEIKYFSDGRPFVQRIDECIRNMQNHCEQAELHSRNATNAGTYVQAETLKNRAIDAKDIVIANYDTAVHLRQSLRLINRTLFEQCPEINDNFCIRSLKAVDNAMGRLAQLLPAHQAEVARRAEEAAKAAEEAKRRAAAAAAAANPRPNIYDEDPQIINLQMPDPRGLSNNYQEIVRR
jgi:hypothetical protein